MIEAWDQDVGQRLSSAVKSKIAGGEHFQQQEYKKAGEYYIQALRHLIPILRSTPEERNIADGLMIACYSNLAGVFLLWIILMAEGYLETDDSQVKW